MPNRSRVAPALLFIVVLALLGTVTAVLLHSETGKIDAQPSERPIDWGLELAQVSGGLISEGSTACGVAMQPVDEASIRTWVDVRLCEDRETELGKAHWAVFQRTSGIDTHGWLIRLRAADGRRCESQFQNYSPSHAAVRRSLKKLAWHCAS